MKNFTKKMMNSIKICLLLLGFVFSGNTLLAQKVAVVGIDHSSPAANGGDYDGISFVATENLIAGTVFYFTNGLYDAPNSRFRSLNASDDGIKFILKYTVPAGGIAKGVVVYIQETNQTTNTFATTCSSGSCGSASFLVYNGAASNFTIGGVVMGVWAYSDTDDNPLNGLTTVHSVLYEGWYDSFSGVSTVGNLPANMNPVGSFPNCIITDGIFTIEPSGTYSTVEFKPSLRSGAVSKLNLEDASNYDKFVSGATSLSTTAFANLNLVNSNPTVGVAVSPSTVTENGATNLTYTFTLSTNAPSNITVNYTVSGTATNGTDYGTLTGTVVIPSGSNTATVTVNPSGDATLEPDETVTLTITSGTGYDIGSPSSATATITNDDTGTSLPKVALVGISHADIGANPTHFDGFSFVALDDLASGTVVYFTRRIYDKTTLVFGNTFTGTVKWTAGAGVNRGDVYTVVETSADVFTVTCSDGSSCGTVTNIDAGFSIPTSGLTMFAYSDNNDNPTDGITEIFSALHTGDLVAFTNGGAIPTNSNPTAIYPNAVVVDNFPNANPGRTEYKFPTERQVTVSRTLLTNVANWLHAQSTATAPSTVRFTNIIVTSGVANPLVTVTASPSSVLENSGSGITYTFTLSQNAASNMTINFGVSGTATFTTDYTQTGATTFTASTGSVVIPSGSNSASVTITPVAETTLEPNETVVLTIDVGTGYDAGSPSVATGTITNDDVRNVNPLVVIVGMNHGNNSNIPTSQNPDGFSFAANQNLTAGTDIYFADALFNNTSLLFGTVESVTKYTVPSGGLAKGQVVYIVETGATTNAFTVTCSAGSNCGTATYVTQPTGTDFSFTSGGDNLYAYSDTDGDPTNGITDVHSLFYAINGSIPSIENPTTVFPNAVVVTGFGSASPDRVEYKFAASERSVPINLANIQNPANYLIGQANQALSVIPFAALSLCPASITTSPSNVAICAGANTTFTVVATGSNLTYQWQVNSGAGFTNIANGGIYSGANLATLTLTNVPFANNGFTYQCVVNACATSTAATLTVNDSPTATIGIVPAICAGANSFSIPFSNITGNPTRSSVTVNGTGLIYITNLAAPPSPVNASINPANVVFGTNRSFTFKLINANGCNSPDYTGSITINDKPTAPTSPTATPSSISVSGNTTTLTATGCSSPSVITWYDSSNPTVALPNNTPAITATKTFFARCTGTNTCVSEPSTNVSVTYNPCVPLSTSPGNVGINWTGLVSTDWNNACNWNPAWVPDATNSAVVIDLQTNQPTITSTVPTVNQIYVNANAILTVSSGGTLNSNSTAVPITLQGGNIINDGTINVSGGGNGVGLSIGATASITNRGTITTNNVIGASLDFGNLTFTNESTGIFNGDFKVNNNILTLTNRGTINYTSGSTFALSLNTGSSVINDGTINITVGSGISNPSGSTINNNACGKILMTTGEYQNGGTTTNAGLIQMPNLYNFTNTGTFTNNGILKANVVSGITNNRMVVTNACPIFTLGGTNNYTVSGIFTDAGVTTSAGTYVSVGNKFTANNTIPAGSQTLYAQATNGTCTFTVPFDFNNRKPTAVSVNNTAICTGASVMLSGTCASGTTLTWYTTATGGSNIGTGTNLPNSPTVATTYYAACESTNCVSGRVATSAVIISSLPTASASSNSPVCAGTTLNLTGGATGNTYLWSGPNSFTSTAQSPSIATATALATGTYTIMVTNSANCSSMAMVSVTVNAIPTATASSNSPVCVGNSISLTGGGVGSYLWTGPGGYSSTEQSPTIANAAVSATGTYTITVTNSSSCTSTATTAVTVNGISTANATPSTQTICSGGAITTIAITGTGTSYTWTRDNTTSATGIAASGSGNISGSLTNTADSPLTVTFTITPVGACNGTPITATVVVNPIPTVTASTPSQTICSGASITGITFNTPAPLRPLLPDPSSDIVPTAPASAKGIVLSGPVAGTVFNWTRDNTVTVTGIAASGSGSISGNLTNTTTSPITVTFTITPSYTNAGTTCTGTPITVTVLVNPNPMAIITDSGTSFCQGGTTTLSAPADPNYTYAWERSLTGIANPNSFTAFGGTAQTQVITTSGVYRVVVTNQYNCSARDTTAIHFADFNFSGSLVAGDATQTGRMNRFAVISTCASPKGYPGDFTTSGTRLYDSYTITNPQNVPVCATIGIKSGCGTGLFSAAYSGSYNPTALGTNYLADPGSSFPLTAFYEATIPANGTIIVVVHELNSGTGCEGYNLTVELPRESAGITVTPNTSICAGTPVNLTASPANSYAWTGGGTFSTQTINPSPTLTTTYNVALGYGNGTCSATTSAQVVVNPIPTASSNSPICAGGTLNLTSETATSYSWTSPSGFTSSSQNPSIANVTASQGGTYTVVTVNGGCTSTATVNVVINPIPSINTGVSPAICAGATLFTIPYTSVTGTPTTYSISGTGITTVTDAVLPASPITVNLSSGAVASSSYTYTLTVKNAGGCVSSNIIGSVSVNAAVVLTCPANITTTACQTQAAVNTAFIAWLATASASGGANGILTNNNTGAPLACGGSTTVTFTYTNDCNPTTSTCQATFTVPTPPTIVLTCPVNATTASCQTQAAVNTAFAAWLATASGSGGCNGVLTNNNTGAPLSTGGSTTVTFTYTSSCVPLTTTCQATFTVSTPPTVVLTCPINANSAACQTQAAVNTAFAAWLTTASASGGCNGVLTNNNTGAPSACGGSTTVTFTYTSTTAPLTTTCQATFTVTAPPTIVLTCPVNTNTTANQTQAAVNTAFTAWLATASGSGGCSGVLTNNSTTAPSACGGSTTVTFTYTSACSPSTTTCEATFTVPVSTVSTTAGNNSPVCAGGTLNLTSEAGFSAYVWTGVNGFTANSQNPSIANATTSATGTYQVIATNANGCTAMATTSATVNPTPATPTPQADTQIIFGGSVSLTATGCSGSSDVLKWYQTADNALVTMPVSPTATTQYYAKCEVTSNGITCISPNSNNVTVTVLQPNPPVATGATICSGSSVTLTATGCSGSVGTFVLKWYLNATDALVTMPVSPTANTDYYAKCEQTFNSVTAISGKSNVVTVTVLNPIAPVATGGTIYLGNSITLTATGCTGLGFVIKWYQTADNVLVTMPVSPTVTTQYYAKCEQTANSVTCASVKSNDVTVTVVNRIFVDITKIAAPIQNGNSWATAYGNLQTGLAAATAGVEVWVAKGTYKPTTTTTRTIYFNIPSSVIVYGGFAGTEDALIDRNFRTNSTILSGDIGALNIDADNSYHVVVMDGSSNTTVLDGFTIVGGYANFDPKRTFNVPLTAPTTATIETGGGILVQNAGMPTIANCTIIQNAAVTGGGLYAGDASMPTVKECKFIANQAGFGSGMYFQDGSNGKVHNTLISGNRGIGGVYNNNSSPMFTNVTFAGNGGYNGGVFNSNSQPVIKNSIIWGNSTPFNDTQSIITYSTIQGGYAGVGNLSMDPKFVSQTPEGLSPIVSGDYHVQASSLTIDRGDNGAITLTDKDLDGNLRRFSGGRVDMGSYEFQGVATATLVISLATGNWESNSTWDVGRVPQLGDYVIIDSNHIVTLNGTGIAKNLEYRGTGQLKFNIATSKLEIGF